MADLEGPSLGDYVRMAREARGLSRRQLSMAAGLSESYVSKLESGSVDPSVRRFAVLARQLGFNQRELFVLLTREAARHTPEAG